MNLLMKHKPWMIAALLATTSVFGQTQSCGSQKATPACKPAKCGMTQAPMQPCVAAYNAPAEINIGMQGEIDFFVGGSFIYWQPLQDNLPIATILSNYTGPLSASVTATTVSLDSLQMNFQYKPGFQVIAGMNLQDDNWVGYAEYTRFYGSHSTSSSGIAGNAMFLKNGSSETSVFANTTSNFTCDLNFVDLMLERVYYVGKNLVMHSAYGARGAWIMESLHNTFSDAHALTIDVAITNDSVNQVQRVHSWEIGPRGGVELDWDLGMGIRFFGTGYADILYSKYHLQAKDAFTLALVTQNYTNTSKIRTLRTHLQSDMGFGWGTYFDNNAWHLDLLASYGFQVFFDQNMFTYNLVEPQYSGNLYVHGLTAEARFDF
ncbi:MAG: hypothetical protein KGI80_00485 [Verrucomicrobiota bacterium]|nr:hypothetical protein [Verrucomicrobiota bacterium]